ncbi:MAG: hypothetical protein ACRC5M_04800 [Anaeroplasmataceae bacterium]
MKKRLLNLFKNENPLEEVKKLDDIINEEVKCITDSVEELLTGFVNGELVKPCKYNLIDKCVKVNLAGGSAISMMLEVKKEETHLINSIDKRVVLRFDDRAMYIRNTIKQINRIPFNIDELLNIHNSDSILKKRFKEIGDKYDIVIIFDKHPEFKTAESKRISLVIIEREEEEEEQL